MAKKLTIQLTALTSVNTLTTEQAAHIYARQGISVFPLHAMEEGKCTCGQNCKSPGKHPRTQTGWKEATADEAQIRLWWGTLYPGANIGMPTGGINSVVVIDVDSADAQDYLQKNNIDQDTLTQLTGRPGGRHLLYDAGDREIKNSVKNAGVPIDIRGDGGYIVVAPSLHASGRRYRWANDYPPAPFPSQLFPLFQRAKKKRGAASTFSAAGTPGRGTPDRIVGEGERNDYLFRQSCVLRDAGYTPEQCFDLVGALNARQCRPPLESEEITAIVRSAHKGPAAVIVNADAIAELRSESGGVSVSAAPGKTGGTEKTVPKNLIPATGLLREIVDYINSQSRFPQPELALAAAITFVGALAGQKYKTQTNLRSNIYIVGLAQSGSGKEAARSCIKTIASRQDLRRYLGGSRIASAPAIYSALQEYPIKTYLIDEFGLVLDSITNKKAPGYKSEIKTVLMDLYSAAGSMFLGTDYADRKVNPTTPIKEPCLTLYGMATHGTFFKALSSADTSSGLLARFLVFDVGRDRGRAQIFETRQPDFLLIEKLIKLSRIETPQGAIAVPTDEQVKIQEIDGTNAMTPKMKKTEASSSIYSRVLENAIKLALVYAIGRDFENPRIDMEAFLWGSRIAMHSAEYLIQNIGEQISDNETEEKNNRVIKLIRDAGSSGISSSLLYTRSRWLTKLERENMLEDMLKHSLIFIERVQTKSKPIIKYIHSAFYVPPETPGGEENNTTGFE